MSGRVTKARSYQALVLAFHCLCASSPVQPNCEIAFQIEWRLAADFGSHFPLRRCCAADDDFRGDCPRGQVPPAHRVKTHHFVDPSALSPSAPPRPVE